MMPSVFSLPHSLSSVTEERISLESSRKGLEHISKQHNTELNRNPPKNYRFFFVPFFTLFGTYTQSSLRESNRSKIMPADVPIVVLGGGAVGKSAITIQFIQGHFIDKYDATIEDIYRKPFETDGVSSVLTIIDTAGQDSFTTMREQYMRRGKGFLLVYSITDAESYQTLKKIYAQLRRTKGENAWIPVVVVGNKSDLAAQRAVSIDEGRLFAQQTRGDYVEITAKDRKQVEKVFDMLVRSIRNENPAPMNPLGSLGDASPQAKGSGSSLNTAGNGSSALLPQQSGADLNPQSRGGLGGGNDSFRTSANTQGNPAPNIPAAKPVPQKKWRCTML